MVEVCHLEVSTAAQRNPSLAGARVIQCRVAGRRMSRTGLATTAVKMKYLIIVALVSIIFVLVYSRVRPYLKLFQQVLDSLNAPQPKTPSRNKLVRCDSCGTWIPADRALKLNSGLATFCSPECMAKKPASKQRKIAG